MLPGHADAAMQLDAGGGNLAAGVGGVGLGHRHRERRVGLALVKRPRGVVGQRLGVLDIDQHVGTFVLDPLIATDRLAEGLAQFGVIDGHVEDALRPAAHLGGERHGSGIDHPRQRRPAVVQLAEQRGLRHGHVVEPQLAEFAGLVDRRQHLDAEPDSVLRHDKKTDAVFHGAAVAGARRDDDDVGEMRVRNEHLAARQRETAGTAARRHHDAGRVPARIRLGRRQGRL